MTGYNYVSGSNTSTCQASGLWTDPRLNCTTTIMCKSPPTLLNANAAYSSVNLYSVASYSCVADHQFFGSSNKSACEMSRSWSGLNGTCERVAFYKLLLPFYGSVPGTVQTGWKMEVIGEPLDVERMTIELRYQDDYKAIQFDVRFRFGLFLKAVARNSFTAEGWGPEESFQQYFPFAVGREFNLTFVVTSSGFDIYVDEVYFVSRQHYVEPSLIDEVVVLRGADVESVKLFYYSPADEVTPPFPLFSVK
ncbi:galectin-related protein B-like [Gigantopelta aegis]|uniref:galectin-related protein B-like n=1 Tax=Gigantopelta aegis TaxID=1735272 RepID=UPI001B887703|nr:galectin-related protein B-like [Gigantopelta aegis]